MAEAIQSLLQRTSSRCSPWQLAAAVSVGVLCGLLPKLTFIFCLIGLACYFLPIHIPLAALVCIVASLSAQCFQPSIGRLGVWALTQSPMRDFWLAVDSLPLVPWLGLHNSVIQGSFLLGLLLFVPVWLSSLSIAKRFWPGGEYGWAAQQDADFEQEIRPKLPSVPALEYVPASQQRNPETETVQRLSPTMNTNEATATNDATQSIQTDPATIQELESLLANCNEADAANMSTASVARRAAEMVAYVDEILATGLESSSPQESLPPEPPVVRDSFVSSEQPQRDILSHPNASRPAPPRTHVDQSPTQHAVQTGETGAAIATDRPARTTDSAKLSRGGPSLTTQSHISHSTPSPHTAAVGARQEEALRYLLHHLKALKEKV